MYIYISSFKDRETFFFSLSDEVMWPLGFSSHIDCPCMCILQGAMSVDSITDLDDNQSRLLEALQLSLPAEAQSKKEKARDKKLSLNPIYRQVPRLVDSCCQHLEKHGKNISFSHEWQMYFYYSINKLVF